MAGGGADLDYNPGGAIRASRAVGELLHLNSASISSSVISAKGESSETPISRSRAILESIESNIEVSSAVARLTLSLTRPRLDRSSKMTTSMTRDATMEM